VAAFPPAIGSRIAQCIRRDGRKLDDLLSHKGTAFLSGGGGMIPGFYLYAGSAFGSGGLRARLGHHLESTAEPHWHIDYLLQIAIPVELWFTTCEKKLEHSWADLTEAAPGLRIPISRFGSSDYHRSRIGHLFYSKRRPSYDWFQKQNRDRFGVEVGRVTKWHEP
jgi:Uri superfamily endonuclease